MCLVDIDDEKKYNDDPEDELYRITHDKQPEEC